MAHDEGIATKNGENLNIQCLLMQLDKLNTSHEKFYHYHSYMELIYVLEGSIVAYIDDCDCKCQRDFSRIDLGEKYRQRMQLIV